MEIERNCSYEIISFDMLLDFKKTAVIYLKHD